MGLLDNAIRRGVNRAVSNTVSNAVSNAVERKVNDAVTQAADKAVPPPPPPQQYTPSPEAQASAAQLGGIFAGWAGAAQSFANEAAKNMKICPACGEGCGADIKFCPSCGAKLPEQTVSQGAVCASCGKQNAIGTKFCADCGAKLPGAAAEEEAARARSEAQLAKWDTLLPQYPKWNLGGSDITLEECDMGEGGYPAYTLSMRGMGLAGLLAQYAQLLKQNGFVTAGQYPSESNLFKRVDGVVYSFSSENAFDGGMDCMSLYFTVREPYGGFDYKKPEPQKPKGWRDMLGI